MRELGRLWAVALCLICVGTGAGHAMGEVEWCFSESCAGGVDNPETIETTNLPSGTLSFVMKFRTIDRWFPTVIGPGSRLVTMEMVDSAGTRILGFGVVNDGGVEKLNIRYLVSPGVYSDLLLGPNAEENDLTITRTPGAGVGSIVVVHNGLVYSTGATSVSGIADQINQGFIHEVNMTEFHFGLTEVMQSP